MRCFFLESLGIVVFGRPFKLSRIFFNSQSESADVGGELPGDSSIEGAPVDADLAVSQENRDGGTGRGPDLDRLSAGAERPRDRMTFDPEQNDRTQSAGGIEDDSGNMAGGPNDNQPDPEAERLIRGLIGSPKILNRDEHKISRKLIDPDALKVLYRLNRSGFLAFLVGGSVRDLLLGKQPKDFDIGTSARPDQVRSLFRNSRTIGRRFKISHVYFRGNHILEVTTFRQGMAVPDETADDKSPGILQPDNVFGDPQSDAFRRDLTINGLFYDVGTLSVIDYVGGVQDLRDGIIRMIGDPYVRVQEDPVRMIRAIRHAARTGFKIEEKTYDAIVTHRNLIEMCPPARVLEELLREFRSGSLYRSLKMLHQTGLLALLVPVLAETVDTEGEAAWLRLEQVLTHLDDIANAGVGLSASMLFVAALVGNLQPSAFSGEKSVLKVFWETDPKFSNLRDDRAAEETDDQDDFEDENGEAEEALPVRAELAAAEPPAGGPAGSEEPRPAGDLPDLHELLGEGVRRILRRQIDELFSKLTLSRHEREMMEIYLVNRLKMFAIARGAGQPQLEGGVSMNNLMLILGLTSLQNPSAHDCFTFWQERVQSRRSENFSRDFNGERPRGPRRRRRRRRR